MTVADNQPDALESCAAAQRVNVAHTLINILPESAEYAARSASGVVYYAEAVDRHLKLAAESDTDTGVTRYHLDAAAVNATMAQAAAILLQSGMGIVRPLDTP